MGSSFTFTLFRHGLTLANEQKKYLGWTDEPLSARGRNQVLETAHRLNTFQPGKIISSDLIRCYETARLLFPNHEIETMNNFREMHFGHFEMHSYDSLKNCKSYLAWINRPFDLRPKAGEDFREFTSRVMKGIDVIQKNLSINHLTLVTHGGVIRLLLMKYIQSNKAYFEWSVKNGQGYQLYWHDVEQFKGGEACTSLLAVPSMEKVSG